MTLDTIQRKTIKKYFYLLLGVVVIIFGTLAYLGYFDSKASVDETIYITNSAQVNFCTEGDTACHPENSQYSGTNSSNTVSTQLLSVIVPAPAQEVVVSPSPADEITSNAESNSETTNDTGTGSENGSNSTNNNQNNSTVTENVAATPNTSTATTSSPKAATSPTIKVSSSPKTVALASPKTTASNSNQSVTTASPTPTSASTPSSSPTPNIISSPTTSEAEDFPEVTSTETDTKINPVYTLKKLSLWQRVRLLVDRLTLGMYKSRLARYNNQYRNTQAQETKANITLQQANLSTVKQRYYRWLQATAIKKQDRLLDRQKEAQQLAEGMQSLIYSRYYNAQ